MGHRAVAVPEYYAAGAKRLQHMANLGQNAIGRARHDSVVRLLLLERSGEDITAAVGGCEVAGRKDATARSQTGQSQERGVGGTLVAREEGIAGSLHILARGLLSEFFSLVNMHLPEVADVLRAGLVAFFFGSLVVELERLPGRLHLRREHDVRDAVARSPLEGVSAHDAGQPDWRMRLLIWTRPRIHIAVMVVLALPAEGTGRRPRLDDEVVRLLESLPVVWRRRVVRNTLAPGAAHPPGDEPATRNHVDDCELLDQPKWVVPDGDDVAEQNNLRALGHAGEDRRLDVHCAAHAEGSAMVLI